MRKVILRCLDRDWLILVIHDLVTFFSQEILVYGCGKCLDLVLRGRHLTRVDWWDWSTVVHQLYPFNGVIYGRSLWLVMAASTTRTSWSADRTRSDRIWSCRWISSVLLQATHALRTDACEKFLRLSLVGFEILTSQVRLHKWRHSYLFRWRTWPRCLLTQYDVSVGISFGRYRTLH